MNKKEQSKQGQAMQMRAFSFEPSTYNKEKRTIDVIYATGVAVGRAGWDGFGWDADWFEYDEILEITNEAIDSTRLDNGTAPVLIDHRANISNIIGSIERSWIQDGKAYASLRLTTNPNHENTIKDIENGIIRSISVGYRVLEYTKTTKKGDSGRDIWYANRWEPLEISFVAIPADSQSSARGEEGEVFPNPKFKNSENQPTEMSKKTEFPTAENEATPAQNSIDIKAAEQRAMNQEKERVASIMDLFNNLPIESGREEMEKSIRDGITFQEAQTRALDLMKSRNVSVDAKPTATVNAQANDVREQKKTEARTNALLVNGFGYDLNKLSKEEQADIRQYMGKTSLELKRQFARENGKSIDDYSRVSMANDTMLQIERYYNAVNKREFITSSTDDFPVLLESAINKQLESGYNSAPFGWRNFVKTISVKDFRDVKFYKLGRLSGLLPIAETEEIKSGSMSDGSSYDVNLETKARRYNLSREILINDDLNAFGQMFFNIGTASQYTLMRDIVRALDDPNGVFFNAANGNLKTATTLTYDNIISIYEEMSEFSETDPDGEDIFFNIQPRLALSNRGLAAKIKAFTGMKFQPNQPNTYNEIPVLYDKVFDTVIGEAWLKKISAWFAFGDPQLHPALVVAFLNNQEIPILENRVAFTQLGIEYRAIFDYKVNYGDPKGAIKQPITQ